MVVLYFIYFIIVSLYEYVCKYNIYINTINKWIYFYEIEKKLSYKL